MSFGELAVLLWMVCNSVYCLCSLQGYLPKWLFLSFHLFVWITSAVMTIIPGAMGLYGLQVWDDEKWCWFREDENNWEIAQFYGPLLFSNILSVLTFSVSYFVLESMTQSSTTFVHIDDYQAAGDAVPENMRQNGSNSYLFASSSSNVAASATAAEQNSQLLHSSTGSEDDPNSEMTLIRLHRSRVKQTFVRLALQNGVLFIVFIPDAILYFVSIYHEEVPHDNAGKLTEFLWKSEGFLLAILWLSNSQVQKKLNEMPIYRRLRACLCCPQRPVSPLSSQIGGRAQVSLASPATVTAAAATTSSASTASTTVSSTSSPPRSRSGSQTLSTSPIPRSNSGSHLAAAAQSANSPRHRDRSDSPTRQRSDSGSFSSSNVHAHASSSVSSSSSPNRGRSDSRSSEQSFQSSDRV